MQFAEDHRGNAGEVPDRMVGHLRRPLGRRGQRRGVRTRPLPARLQRPRHQRRTSRLQGHLDPHRPARIRGARRHPGDGRSRASRSTATSLNPYLSPAAVKRWEPFIDEVVRASIDEKIEAGRIDFVDDLANIVPGGADAGDARNPDQEVGGLQRADARGDLHPGGLPGRRAGGEQHREMGIDLRHQPERDPGEPPPGSGQRDCSTCVSTASRPPTSRCWACSAC